jgi:hypothetical protein
LNNPPSIANAREIAKKFFEAIESRGWRHLRRRTEMALYDAFVSKNKGRADLVIWDEDCINIIDFKHISRLTAEDETLYAQQLNRYARSINAGHKRVKGWLVLLKSGEWREMPIIS